MEITNSISILAALAHESRLVIFKCLVEAGHSGLQPSELSAHIKMPAATLSFHLKELFHANLVSKVKKGRAIIYTANYQTMNQMIEYLQENCCSGDFNNE